MDLELRHLRVIVTLADELSFSRAADRLGLPQSALSSQLARIEKALGVSLFDRTTRSVLPTAAADRLLPLARAAADAARDFETTAGMLRGAARRDLLVAVDPSLLGALSAVLGRTADPVYYSLREGAAALEAVSSGVADLAWGYDHPGRPFRPAPHVRCATVGADPLWIALPATHRLAGEDGVRLADLADEAWVAQPCGTDGHDHFVELCHAAGFLPDIRYTAGSLAVVPELVGSGACVALASPLTRMTPTVRMVPLRPATSRRTVLAWHQARCPAALADAVHSGLRSHHRDIVADLR